MRFFISENKTLYFRPDYEIYNSTGEVPYILGAHLQLKGTAFQKEIECKINKAIASVLKEYEPQFAELDLKPIFDEKRRQLKESFDTDEALAKIVDIWDCAELTEREWT